MQSASNTWALLGIIPGEGGKARTNVPILQMTKPKLGERKVPSEHHSQETTERRHRLSCSASCSLSPSPGPRPCPPSQLTLLSLPHPQARPGSHRLKLGPWGHLRPPARPGQAPGRPRGPQVAGCSPSHQGSRETPHWARQTPDWLPAPRPSDPGCLRPRQPGSQHQLFSSQMKGSQAFRGMFRGPVRGENASFQRPGLHGQG